MKISEEMFDSIPALLASGRRRQDIAELFGVTVNSLQVQCSKRGLSLRDGGALIKRAKVMLPDEPLPLSNDVLRSLRVTARALGRTSAATLISDLLEKIVSDNLFNAVLDEETAS